LSVVKPNTKSSNVVGIGPVAIDGELITNVIVDTRYGSNAHVLSSININCHVDWSFISTFHSLFILVTSAKFFNTFAPFLSDD
jgi:hypothetical protein